MFTYRVENSFFPTEAPGGIFSKEIEDEKMWFSREVSINWPMRVQRVSAFSRKPDLYIFNFPLWIPPLWVQCFMFRKHIKYKYKNAQSIFWRIYFNCGLINIYASNNNKISGSCHHIFVPGWLTLKRYSNISPKKVTNRNWLHSCWQWLIIGGTFSMWQNLSTVHEGSWFALIMVVKNQVDCWRGVDLP